MRKIKFIKDFATYKKGDEATIDGMIASNLVTRKIAKYVDAQEINPKGGKPGEVLDKVGKKEKNFLGIK